jgi:hypothetical protein
MQLQSASNTTTAVGAPAPLSHAHRRTPPLATPATTATRATPAVPPPSSHGPPIPRPAVPPLQPLGLPPIGLEALLHASQHSPAVLTLWLAPHFTTSPHSLRRPVGGISICARRPTAAGPGDRPVCRHGCPEARQLRL